MFFFFFQAEDGIRDLTVTGVQTCALPISARTNVMFYERAFWLFSTGHRLGDMRRLLRQYQHPDSTVYPTGVWFKGGNYRSEERRVGKECRSRWSPYH